MDLGDQSEMHPNPSFRTENQSQFASQYSYSQSNSAFPIDQDMNMSTDNFAASVQAHADASLENPPGALIQTQNAGNISASPTAMNAPGMAPPPQGVSQPYSPTGPRPSIDDGQDGGLTGSDAKRRRSKVSRACDECRRKKVRCDAAAEDGTIKTCSNCTRAGLTCEYSRVPMKRGPSKGYIKELSERVQQVESLQMALSNTPGYRQSLDATTVGIYTDPPFSPDDPPSSIKRNFSFSGDQRSPFGAPEYNRERMPSLGGWNSGSPHSSTFRARDRGSIAVAPDQQPTNTISFAKPFWLQDLEEQRPSKRQKIDADSTEKLTPTQTVLSTYYEEFHTNLPILPDADASITIIDKSSPKVQHAFIACVRSLPRRKSELQNGSSNVDPALETSSDIYKSREELEDFMWDAARQSPESRSSEDNLLCLWTYLLMAVECEGDLTRLHNGTLPRTILIKQAVDLGWSCVTASTRRGPLGSETGSNKPLYLNDFARAWHCATVMARLHALAVGSGNPIPMYSQQNGIPAVLQVLPPTAAIVTLAAGLLTTISVVVQDPLPPSQFGRNLDLRHRTIIQEQLDWGIASRPEATENSTFVEELRLFVDLLLSRYTSNFHPLDIIIPAAALADALRKNMTVTQDSVAYNPFRLHFFTLTTITLLEFTQEGSDTEMYKMARNAVETIKGALEQISEKDNPEDGSSQEAAVDAPVTVDVKKPIHWADALLKMISERSKINANDSSNGSGTGTTNEGRGTGDGTNAALDFSLLLKHGYLNVLSQQVC